MAPEGNREMQAAAPLVAAVLAPAGSSLAPLAPAAERDARSTATAHPGHHNGLVSWLHIPKCGSSFVAALAGAFCQSIPSEHSVECSLNGSISHWTLSPTRQCPFHHGDVPYCNADGKRPMRDGMPDGVLPSYYALYPASEYCAPGFEWDHGPIHRAVEKDANDAHIAGVVTMLRAPRQRLISAFNGGAHACIGLGGNNLRRMYAGRRRRMQRRDVRARPWRRRLPGAHGHGLQLRLYALLDGALPLERISRRRERAPAARSRVRGPR